MIEIDDEDIEGTLVPTKQNIQPDHIQCTACKEIKPRKEFIRTLTKAQSSALLKRPTNTRLKTISKKCKDCWTKAKRTKPLTRKEIQNKMVSGDMHSILGELKIKELDESANAKKKRGAKNRWNNHRADLLGQYRKALMGFVRSKYVYWKGCRAELKEWAEQDYLIAKQHAEELIKEFNPKTKPAPPNQIADCYTPTELADLQNLFNAIPPEIRAKLRRVR